VVVCVSWAALVVIPVATLGYAVTARRRRLWPFAQPGRHSPGGVISYDEITERLELPGRDGAP
jgi:hypothetical protein